VVSPADLDTSEASQLAAASAAARPQPLPDDLGAYIRQRWEAFRNARNSGQNPLNERLLRAQRMFEGQYDPAKLVEIRRFGGSEVYSRMVAVKCRGATSLLRDVYLGAERPWSIEPQPDPPVSPDAMMAIVNLIQVEAQQLRFAGQPAMPSDLHARYIGLVRQATAAAKRVAQSQAEAAADKIDDILIAGKFYDALAEFLVDIALYPFAVLKGPVVRMVPKLVWQGKQPTMQTVPQMFWERVDPFNFYWSPGSAYIEDAECIERKKFSRADLNDLLGLPGFNDQAIRGALDDYATGLRDWLDAPDTQQALNAGREAPQRNETHLIDGLEYHGNIQGSMLLDQGVGPDQVPDPTRDYMVQSWVVGRHTIKTQINPSPRKRHPYFVSSFEKVPGTIAGHGLPDILGDLQEIGNATLRALVNNISIASGPQVVINTELLDPTVNEDQLYPWKRWKVVSDPLGNNREPVTFFQPGSNAQELMAIYSAVNGMGDDISAIPRYTTGESLKGGAGRTASGLSMLMGNAQKVLQTVAANIDLDVMKGVLDGLYDMIMLTDDTGILSGDEQVQVNGVVVALQKETEQQKQLQFLQITGNPIDAQIVGEVGRARVLRSLATGLGLGDDVVPDDDTVQQEAAQQKQTQAAAQQMQLGLAAAKAQGGRAGGAPSGGAPGGQAGQVPPGPAPAAQGQDQAPPPPPLPGARFAPDGNHYVPDPRPGRQGKYMMVH
jgi:hypothetical protein